MKKSTFNDKKFPYIYFFVGPEGLSWGRIVDETEPVLARGEANSRSTVTLKNHHSTLFSSQKFHVVPNVIQDLAYDVPILINGESIEFRAKIFLHDYFGNRLEGTIPIKAAMSIEQFKGENQRLRARIAAQAKEMFEIRAEYEKKLDKMREEFKKFRATFYQQMPQGEMQ